MKRRNPAAQVPESIRQFITLAPAYHRTGPDALRHLKKVVDMAECGPGQKLPQKAFGELMGVPPSSINDWFETGLPPQIQALVCGLERLPETDWLLFLREFCRECPRLEHPTLGRDAEAIRSIKELLARAASLMLISGSLPGDRTLFWHVLGNSSRRFGPMRRISGLDVTGPTKFSPVPGVFYLRRALELDQRHQVASEMWPVLKQAACEVMVLNGVISALPEILPELVKISKERLVILADDFSSGLPKCNATIVSVTRDQGRPSLLRLSIARSA